MTGYTAVQATAGHTAGGRGCRAGTEQEAWLTCSASDPTAGLAAGQTKLLQDIPGHLAHRLQCVESCRGEGFSLAVQQGGQGSGRCICARYNHELHLFTILSLTPVPGRTVSVTGQCLGPGECGPGSFTVYRVADIQPATTCSQLYYRRQVGPSRSSRSLVRLCCGGAVLGPLPAGELRRLDDGELPVLPAQLPLQQQLGPGDTATRPKACNIYFVLCCRLARSWAGRCCCTATRCLPPAPGPGCRWR